MITKPCGLTVIEAMAGEKTRVVDPMLGWRAALRGQELQVHQVKAIDEATAVVRSRQKPTRLREDVLRRCLFVQQLFGAGDVQPPLLKIFRTRAQIVGHRHGTARFQ